MDDTQQVQEEKKEEDTLPEEPAQPAEAPEDVEAVPEEPQSEATVEETSAKEEKEPEKPQEEPAEEETTPAPTMQKADDKRGNWYIVHTYSGHEDKVAKSLKQRVESMGFGNKIFDIIVPTRNTIKVSQGKKENVKEKIFPGYVLVRMDLDDETWLLVRTTQGVTAFIGAGNKPTPISEKEVEAIQKFMNMEEPLYKATFTPGQPVKIVDGPFADFLGTIDSIDEARGKLKVLVTIFGRETPVELDFLQVNKI